MRRTPELSQIYLADPRGPQLYRQGRLVELRVVPSWGDTERAPGRPVFSLPTDKCWHLLAGRHRGGADLHLFVDGPDNGGPGSTHFVVEARLQRLRHAEADVRTRLLLSGTGMSAECALATHGKKLSPARFSVSGLALPQARVVTRKSANQTHTKVSPIPSYDCPGWALLL
jgi:hypothetical protein